VWPGWDSAKAVANVRKHGVAFEEAGFYSWRTPSGLRIISARRATRREQEQYEEGIDEPRRNGLRREYDLARPKEGVRGKYYQRALAGTNLVLLEPDVARVFPDSNSVNRALRRLLPGAGSETLWPLVVGVDAWKTGC
jgi:hypothetical protein